MSGLATSNGSLYPPPVDTLSAAERHYTPSEIAVLWHLSAEMIRRLFQNEPGVMVIQGPIRKGKRPYKTIRIPHSVLERVRVRLQR